MSSISLVLLVAEPLCPALIQTFLDRLTHLFVVALPVVCM